MVQLKIVESVNRTLIGAINWFAVHPTSMNYTSCFISSDNVGYAALLLEKHLNKNSLTGKVSNNPNPERRSLPPPHNRSPKETSPGH
jgi:hypothetical protein